MANQNCYRITCERRSVRHSASIYREARPRSCGSQVHPCRTRTAYSWSGRAITDGQLACRTSTSAPCGTNERCQTCRPHAAGASMGPMAAWTCRHDIDLLVALHPPRSTGRQMVSRSSGGDQSCQVTATAADATLQNNGTAPAQSRALKPSDDEQAGRCTYLEAFGQNVRFSTSRAEPVSM